MKNSKLDISWLCEFLKRLDSAKIHYRLDQIRENFVAIDVAVPGERWEIEISKDGAIEIERYKSDGTIFDEVALEELFEKFSD